MRKPKKSKRFIYNLESILKVRKIRETQQEEQYRKAEKQFLEEVQKEKALRAQQAGAYESLRTLMTEGDISNMQFILLHKAHIESLKEKIIEQEKIREEAEKLKKLSNSDEWDTEGLCEECDAFSSLLKVEGRLLCQDCRNELF